MNYRNNYKIMIFGIKYTVDLLALLHNIEHGFYKSGAVKTKRCNSIAFCTHLFLIFHSEYFEHEVFDPKYKSFPHQG